MPIIWVVVVLLNGTLSPPAVPIEFTSQTECQKYVAPYASLVCWPKGYERVTK